MLEEKEEEEEGRGGKNERMGDIVENGLACNYAVYVLDLSLFHLVIN